MADLAVLLEKTSRTFALSIPLLPQPTRQEVTVAYLLFRIADTFEDSAAWSRRARIEALRVLCDLLEEPRSEDARLWARMWSADAPIDHDGYLELLAETPAVLEAFSDLSAAARSLIREHTTRTAEGMAGYVTRTDERGELHLADLQELRDYCYVVAGIVGEMLTELFLLGRRELEGVRGDLRARSRFFGEGLQLTNILKDSSFDLTEGRSYLPPGVSRSELFELARSDLQAAAEYVRALQGAGTARGLVAFNALPVLLAFATLKKVQQEGPGSKITRPEVWALVQGMESALDDGRPVIGG